LNHRWRRLAAAAWMTASVAAVAPGSYAQSAQQPSLRRMVGQLMLVRMQGGTPSPSFLDRIRRGEIGGIVLYRDNYGHAGPAELISELQRTAAKGGQPRLLIAIDQEGGVVRRLPGAPSLAPRDMSNATIAEAQGLSTARNLRSFGINVDLAPVLDVGHGGFITNRTFGTAPEQVAVRAAAFARGLSEAGVIATGKHFPGLGYATSNTDSAPTVIPSSRRALIADLVPYRRAISQGLKMIMVSTALYPALDGDVPAACSTRVVTRLLRQNLGFDGVVITDDLETRGVNHYLSAAEAAVKAIDAGVDMVLAAGVTGQFADRTSEAAYRAIVTAARRRELSRQQLVKAYARVLTLKRALS
jgi:beta-N-acetylhexosaminidase